jgi:DNA-binding MarR family transcriptional regulator
VTLTDAGRAVLADVFPGHIETLNHLFFAGLSADDVDVLADVLARARDHMRAAPPRSARPRRTS